VSSAPCRAAISPSRRAEYQQRSAAKRYNCNADIILGSLRSSPWGSGVCMGKRGGGQNIQVLDILASFGYFGRFILAPGKV